MSLTVALSLLGAAVLALLAGHAFWQARRATQRRVVVAPPSPPPREAGIEPSFEAAPVPAAEPAVEPPRPPRRTTPRIDALIDAVATLAVEVHISGDMAITHLPPTRRAGSKPFFVEGLNVATREWEPPAAGQRYSEFQAGVQLANRGGALNEIEYSEFVQKVQAFADAIGASPDFPDMLEVVARARDLDAFAGEHDAQLAVHLRSRSVAWSVGYIQQHAARHGFVAGMVPGRLVLPAAEEGAPPVLTLSFDSQAALADDPNQAALRDVTLSFDVPQTDALVEPFITWQASAQALSLGMDAAIVDDNGAALSADSFGSIGAELTRLYDELAARDLAAGSAAARRVFS
ncbi:MAG: cell division protein FtsZ [Piscinibacter sp.]|nr:cell division protein FtsZ [Piscinibacter sp.]